MEKKIHHLLKTVNALGKVGLLIVENEAELAPKVAGIRQLFMAAGYQEASDYLNLMDLLDNGQTKIFYGEREEKLNSKVLEIISEFEAGMVSLSDQKNHTGLKVSQWNPAKVSLVIILTRQQVEKSYPRLFEYTNITQSI